MAADARRTYAPLFESGKIADIGAPLQPGHFYFAEDAYGGALYLSFDGRHWVQTSPGMDQLPITLRSFEDPVDPV